MKKIHLLAAVLLLGGVSCLHVKRERMDNGTAFSWWPSSNTTQLPTTPLRVQAEPTASSSTQPALLPDKSSVVVGGRMEKSFDHPADNSVRFMFEREPDAASTYVLEYELYGAAHAAELSSGWNDEPNTGASRFATRAGWVKQRELIHPSRLQRGENVLRFNRLAATDFYELRNIRLTQTTTPQSSVLVSDAEIPVYDSTAVLRVYLAQDAQLWVAGALKELKKGYHVVETKLDKREGTVKLRANMADGSSEQWELTTVGITNAAARQQQAIPTAETVLAKPDVAWLYEGSYVNLTAKTGAVTEEVNVKIQALRKNDLAPLAPGMINVTAGAAGYRLLPDNIRFNDNIRLSLRIDSALVPQGFSVAHVRTYYFDEEKRSWTMLPQDSLEKSGLWAGAYTDHFTDFINAIIKAPELPGNQAHVPTSFSGLSAANPLEGINQIAPPSANAKGDLNLSFPIEVPKGRNGMEPSLQLVYNSSGGNGYFGLGWNMNFPNIQVDTRWGVPRYLDGEESEAYLVNGEQLDVVAHQLSLTNPRQSGMVEFRYRVEGRFDRIIRYGNSPLNYTWEVHEKSGKVFYYGRRHNEQTANPQFILSGDKGIAYWALAEVKDQEGNLIQYQYINSYGGQRIHMFPTRITYTGKAQPYAEGKYEILFDIRIPSGEPGHSSYNPIRSDEQVDMRYGFPVWQNILIRNIRVNYNQQPIRTYYLHYREGAFKKTILCNMLEYVHPESGSIPYDYEIASKQASICQGNQRELLGNEKVHQFDYYEFDNNTTSIFDGGRYIEGNLPFQLTGITDNGGNLKPSRNFFENLAYPGDINLQNKGTLAQTRGYNLTGDISLYVGLGKKVISKANSISVGRGWSISQNRTSVGMFDVNGDGYPDRVFKSGPEYFYQPILRTGNILNYAPDGILLSGFSGLGESVTNQKYWKIQAQVKFFGLGVNAGYNTSNTISTVNRYLVDYNADGFVDVVDNGSVLFNSPTSVENVRNFSLMVDNILPIDDCNSYDFTGHVKPSLGVEYVPRIDPKRENRSGNENAVSVWIAPRAGDIIIHSEIAMKQPANQDSWKRSFANGVQYDIQIEDIIINSGVLNAADFTPQVYSSQATISVGEGTRIFFRLKSKGNNEYDEVDWKRTIVYAEQAGIDVDDKDYIVHDAEADFLLNERRVVAMPYEGEVNLSLYIQSDPLTDDAVLKVTKNGLVIHSYSFTAGQTISYTHAFNQLVNEDDEIEFVLHSDSKVDYSGIISDATIEYISTVELGTLPSPGTEWTDIIIRPTIDYNPYTKILYNAEALNLSAGNYTISPNLSVPSTYSGKIFLTAKSSNQLLGKLEMDCSGGAVNFVNGVSSFELVLSSALEVHFSYSFASPIISTGIVNLVDVAGNGTTTVFASLYTRYSVDEKKYGTLYRGWGQFVYSGSNIHEIDLSVLNLSLETLVATWDNGNEEIDIQSGTGALHAGTPTELTEMQTEFSPVLDAVSDARFFKMQVDLKNNCWQGVGANGRVTKKELHNSEYLNELSDIVITNPVPNKTTSTSAKALSKRTVNETVTWSAGAGSKQLNNLGANGSLSLGTGIVLNDYLDMNGDGFPDNLSQFEIQFTNPRGGLEDGGSVALSNTTFSETRSNLYGGTVSGSPNVWVDEICDSRVLTSSGIAKTDVRSEGNINTSVAVMGGENVEAFGVLDVNGDGLPDMVKEDHTFVLNNGYGFGMHRSWNLNTAISKSEMLSFGPDLGVGFDRMGVYEKGEMSWAGGINANRSTSDVLNFTVDINGDGLNDVLSVDDDQPSNLVLHLNTGTNFIRQNGVNWGDNNFTPRSVSNSISGHVAGTLGIFFLPSIKVGANASGSGGFVFSRERGRFLDLNNDGFVDYLEDEPAQGKLKVYFNQIGKTNKLKKVHTVTGATMAFDYQPLITTSKMPHARWLFTAMVIDDRYAADGNKERNFTFTYHNPNYDRFERVFLGFDSVNTNVYDARFQNILVQNRERYHNSDIFFSGLKYREATVNLSGNTPVYWAIKTYHYVPHRLSDGAQMEKICGEYYPALAEEYTYLTEGHPTLFMATKKTYKRGPKGVITAFEDYGDLLDATDDYVATIEYTQTAAYYIIGLPTKIQVKAGTLSAAGTLLRERLATYDGQGNMTEMRVLLSGSSGSGTYATDNYYYDTYGNITRHVYPPNAQGERYEMNYAYDAITHTFPITVTDYWGLSSSFLYNYRLGKPTRFTDAYGNYTDYWYNANGKTLAIRGPKEVMNANNTLQYSYWDDIPYTYAAAITFWAKTLHHNPQSPNTPIQTILFTDGLGQELQVKKTAMVASSSSSGPVLSWIMSGWQRRDILGRVTNQWYPTTSTIGATNTLQVYSDTDAVRSTRILYDFMNRPVKTIFPDNTEENNTYTLVNVSGKVYANHVVEDALSNTLPTATETMKDITGNTVRVMRGTSNITSFSYSPINELLSTTDPDNHQTEYAYDKTGRLIKRTHPDAGIDQTVYDAAGNVIERKRNQQAVNGGAITYTYNYNRLMAVEYPNNQENNVYYEYGQSGAENGRVQRIEDGSGAHEFAYGNMGEVIRKTTTLIDLNDMAYTFSSFWEYDSWGRINRLVYPDGEEVHYSYDAGGKLTDIRVPNGDKYLTSATYDKFGNKLKEVFDNGTQMEYTYSTNMQRLTNLKALHQGSAFLNVNYAYDDVGNITSINNLAQAKDNIGGAFSHTYTYDEMYRLATANGSRGPSSYQLNLNYSASGNILGKNLISTVQLVDGTFQDITYNNQYSFNTTKPHQIETITDNLSNTTLNFEWDLNGNMSLHVDKSKGYPNHRRMCWDEENRMLLSADEEQMAGYVYDAGGMRTHKASGTVVYSTVNGYPNSFATVSAFTLYPSELITVSSGMYTKHYYNGSSRIASRIGGGFNQHNDLNNYSPALDHVQLQNGNDYTNKAQQLRNVWSRNASCAGLDQNLEYAYSLELNPLFANSQPDGARYFYHSDHLGSSGYITTENGYATQFLAYMPFGETLSEQQNSTSYYSPFTFSAKEKDIETGYSYFGARYYSPELSVWLGVDPLSDEYPSWSPYNYCLNNPVILVDLDGRRPTPSQAAAMAAHIYTGKKGQVVEGWTLTEIHWDFNNLGYKSGVYTRMVDGVMEYTMVNMGTIPGVEEWNRNSMLENLEQPFGGSEHIQKSLDYAKELSERLGRGVDLTFVGHSKGGAEAAANAVATNRAAFLFNPAAVNLKAYGLDSKNYTERMIAFVVKGDPVAMLYPFVNAKPIDELIFLPRQSWNPLVNHSNFIEALQDYLKYNSITP